MISSDLLNRPSGMVIPISVAAVVWLDIAFGGKHRYLKPTDLPFNIFLPISACLPVATGINIYTKQCGVIFDQHA